MSKIALYNTDCMKFVGGVEDNSIDLVVIDPPYALVGGGYSGGGGCFGTKKRNYHKEYMELYHEENEPVEKERLRINANAERLRSNLELMSMGFDFSLLSELDRVMKKTNIYIWCSKMQVRKILEYYENKGCNTDILTWHKTNPIPTCNGTYLNDTEYLIFAREKGVKVYGSYATKKKYYVTKANVEDKKKYLHPTIKPLPIIKNLIINSSQEGDTVLDCFMGSGTTGVACKELNRNFIGVEIDKTFFDIAKCRIEEQ